MKSGTFKGVARCSAIACFALAAASHAAVFTWGGSDGEYTNGLNWVGGAVPDLSAAGNTAVIASGDVTYTPGGDLAIHNGSTLQISGGSFIQAGGIAWMQFQGGNILVDGGTFSQGTSGNLLRDAGSSVACTAGTVNWTGNLIYDLSATGALSLSGTGTIITAGEFKPIDNFSMVGGTLVCSLISFADGPGHIAMSGGRIEVDGSGGNSGFYGGSVAKSLDFTTGSTGELFFQSYTLAELAADNFLNNGTITYNGAVNAGLFTTSEVDGGVLVAIPEPSALALSAFVGISLIVLRRFRM